MPNRYRLHGNCGLVPFVCLIFLFNERLIDIAAGRRIKALLALYSGEPLYF